MEQTTMGNAQYEKTVNVAEINISEIQTKYGPKKKFEIVSNEGEKFSKLGQPINDLAKGDSVVVKYTLVQDKYPSIVDVLKNGKSLMPPKLGFGQGPMYGIPGAKATLIAAAVQMACKNSQGTVTVDNVRACFNELEAMATNKPVMQNKPLI